MKFVWGLLGTLCLTSAAHAVPVVIQVNGPDGAPVAGAEVRTARWPDGDLIDVVLGGKEALYESARSDAKGVARFDWPASKFGTVPGVKGKFVGAATVWAPGLGATNVTLSEGDNSVKLALAGVARGIVRDAQGAPLAGAKVRALGALDAAGERSFLGWGRFSVTAEEAAFVGVSDAQGRWQIDNLPLGGKAQVQLADAPYATDSSIAPIVAKIAANGGAPVAPAPGGGAQNGELHALPGATLTGRVVDAQGAPVANVMVWARETRDAMEAFRAPQTFSTNEKGEFRFERLEAQSYRIVLRPPNSSTAVAGAPGEIEIASGQTLVAPDQKLIAGGTLVLQISDAKTGQPVSGVSAMAQSTEGGNLDNLIAANSDAKGEIRLHVAPGTYSTQIYQTPDGYVQSFGPSSVATEPAKVAVGETKTIAFKLQSGAVAQGRVVDEQGKAVPNLGFTLRAENGGAWNGGMVETDATGAWKTQQFAPGSYKVALAQNEEWQLVEPKTLEIPGKTAREIKVKPLAQIQLTGRVVDGEGQGIASVNVSAKITIPTENYQLPIERQAVTDEQGNYTLPQFPVTAKTIAISATRAGYVVQKVPETKNENTKWSASDGVLQALTAHVGGTVIDAQNAPQKGVQVLAARFGTVAVSDEKGAWQFDAVAPGAMEIVAVGAAGAIAQSVETGRDDLKLKLQPSAPAKPGDIDGAIAVLDEAWQTSNGRKFYARESLPATIAPYDPDAALALARGGDAKASDDAALQIVQVLARADAERAREWAPQVLAGLEDKGSQLSADVAMARALVEAHPDEAKAYFVKAAALYEGEKQRDAVARLAVLSAQLKLPDAPKWFERTLEVANDPADRYRDYSSFAWRVGAVSTDWATQIVEAAIKSAPDQADYVQGPESAASAAIRSVATWDLPAAQKLLDKYGTLKSRYNSDYEIDRARAAIVVETLRKNQDVDAALKSARELSSSKIPTLSRIAALAPTERRGDILREALKLARANSYQNATTIWLAWQLLSLNAELAKKTLDEIRLTLDDAAANGDPYSRSTDIGWWAFAYRTIDIAQSRWLVEREWARLNTVTTTPDDQYRLASEQQNLILAMATLDVPRAQQMIFALPIDEEGGAPFASAQLLARWMLASADERQTRAFGSWEKNNPEEGLYDTGW